MAGLAIWNLALAFSVKALSVWAGKFKILYSYSGRIMQNGTLSQPIYMDYSATTPIDPRVVDRMVHVLREQYGNPASRSHAYGWEAEQAVEDARKEVAALVNCDSREIVWTSGAT